MTELQNLYFMQYPFAITYILKNADVLHRTFNIFHFCRQKLTEYYDLVHCSCIVVYMCSGFVVKFYEFAVMFLLYIEKKSALGILYLYTFLIECQQWFKR